MQTALLQNPVSRAFLERHPGAQVTDGPIRDFTVGWAKPLLARGRVAHWYVVEDGDYHLTALCGDTARGMPHHPGTWRRCLRCTRALRRREGIRL